jgi:UDP-GlcNAc:undecaprenyl-phosphate GlcNAc-1-phosphate transferase
MLTSYLAAFAVCLVLSVTLTWIVRSLAQTHGWLEAPKSDRHVHTLPVARIGGVAICVSFMVTIGIALIVRKPLGLATVLAPKTALSLLGPAFLVFLLGLYDDLRGATAYEKFCIQAVAATMLYFGGFGIHHLDLIFNGHRLGSVLGLPLTIFWTLLITNAFNLIDGLDGLAAGSALFSAVAVFVISVIVPDTVVSFVTIALAGAILGFLRFNFHPASIFLGDSGSLFIGFMLSALALVGSEKAPTMVAVAIPVVSLGLPILDVALAVARRFVGGKPLFDGDRQHIHHKLLKRGLSQRDAVLILYAVTAGFGLLSLVLLHNRATIALILVVVGVGVFVGVQKLRYQEFAELASLFLRAAQRRQILANHVAIRHAAESLGKCDEFQSICQTVQYVLEPIGFDGMRLEILKPNGLSPSLFHPFMVGPSGSLQFLWSQSIVPEPSWELRLELVTNSSERRGYVTFVRMSTSKTLPLDINVLNDGFQTSLSNALHRAFSRLEASKQTVQVHETQVHRVASSSF